MVVEKRRELKNKIIVGGLLNKDRKASDSPYTQIIAGRSWDIVYYVLDLNSGEVSSLPSTALDYGSRPSMAAVGSRLYTFENRCVGRKGNRDYNETTEPKPTPTPKTRKGRRKMIQQQQGLYTSYCLDLTKPLQGWRLVNLGEDPLLPMSVITFGGKMYVFSNPKFSFICEVFDPETNEWRRLKSPPFPASHGNAVGGDKGEEALNHPSLMEHPVLADYKNNRMIACFNNISTMYAYYPSLDRWECVVQDFIGWCTGVDPVTMADDGIIYVYNPTYKAFFGAYDSETKQWLNVRLSPEAEAVHADCKSYLRYRYYHLLHRGNGLLCLVASSLDVVDYSPTTPVHVVQFKVNINHSKEEVLVTPFSSQYYHLNSRCSAFRYLPV